MPNLYSRVTVAIITLKNSVVKAQLYCKLYFVELNKNEGGDYDFF